MCLQNKIKNLLTSDIITITSDQLYELQRIGELIYEEDTLISDFIRLFKMENFYLFQEHTPKYEILLRKFDDKNVAERFIEDRLKLYEKMWNGCGCRINYF